MIKNRTQNSLGLFGGGMWRGCSMQDPSAKLVARPLGLRTPGAGQATPAGHAPDLGHLALGLPSLCVGQTKHICGAWIACLCAGKTSAHVVLGLYQNPTIFRSRRLQHPK